MCVCSNYGGKPLKTNSHGEGCKRHLLYVFASEMLQYNVSHSGMEVTTVSHHLAVPLNAPIRQNVTRAEV